MRNSISFMIITSFIGLSAVAIALVTFISLHKFDQAFRSAINDRYAFVLEDVREALEAEMRVGLPLENLTNAANLLDDAQRRDASILSVEVFNASGRTVFSTDRSFLGDIVPDGWEQAAKQADGALWTVNEAEAVALGIGLRDMLNAPTGGLVLRFSVTQHADKIAGLEATALKRAAWLWAIGSLATIVIILMITRPLCRYFLSLESTLASLVSAKSTDFELIEESVNSTIDPIASQQMTVFAKQYRTANHELSGLEASLQKIDEET